MADSFLGKPWAGASNGQKGYRVCNIWALQTFPIFFFFFGNAPDFSNLAYQDNNVEIQAGVTSVNEMLLLLLVEETLS